MAKFRTVTYTGESGSKYTFTAYSRDSDFNAVGAVYFITRRTGNDEGGYSHTKIYVGETSDLSSRPLSHHRKECFDKHQANCVCLLVEDDHETRLEIELDLRRKYNPPCNLE